MDVVDNFDAATRAVSEETTQGREVIYKLKKILQVNQFNAESYLKKMRLSIHKGPSELNEQTLGLKHPLVCLLECGGLFHA